MSESEVVGCREKLVVVSRRYMGLAEADRQMKVDDAFRCHVAVQLAGWQRFTLTGRSIVRHGWNAEVSGEVATLR